MRSAFSLTVAIVFVLVFVLPAAERSLGRKKFFLSVLYNALEFILGIVIPVLYFYLSAALAPEWKGAVLSEYSCIIETKYILTPLAIWAWISFYADQILKVQKESAWIVLGLFTGCIGSIVSALSILLLKNNKLPDSENYLMFLFYPPLIYVPVWYGLAAYFRNRRHPVKFEIFGLTALIQGGWWYWATRQSIEVCNKLPESQPDCYVVTASTYGYDWIVRPAYVLDSQGKKIRVSKQLLRFRAFEQFWSKNLPKSHRIFRKCYDVVGPKFAARIRGPFPASMAFLLMKPLELFIAVLLAVDFWKSDRKRNNSKP